MIKLQIALYAMLGTIALLNPAEAQSPSDGLGLTHRLATLLIVNACPGLSR